MHFTAPQKELSHLVDRCRHASDNNAANPVLTNLLCEAQEGLMGQSHVRVLATDLYISVEGRMRVDVVKPGKFCFPAKDFHARVNALPNGPVEVKVENAQVQLKAGGAARRFSLAGLDGNEFPDLPKVPTHCATGRVPAPVLADLLRKTMFSVSDDTTRAHVNSALLEWSQGSISMVSTDGHRLSRVVVTTASDVTMSALIPQKGLIVLKNLIDSLPTPKNEPPPELEITQADPFLHVRVGDLRFSSKLVDAQFPPYKQVVPTNWERTVRVPRTALLGSVKAMAIAADNKTSGIKFTLAPNTLRVTGESPDTGSGFDEIGVDYDGKPVTIGLNAKYAIELLSAIDADEVVLKMSGEFDPCMVVPGVEPAGTTYLGVIMPMRI